MSAEDFSTRESVNCQAIIEPVQERPIRIVRTLAVVPPKSDAKTIPNGAEESASSALGTMPPTSTDVATKKNATPTVARRTAFGTFLSGLSTDSELAQALSNPRKDQRSIGSAACTASATGIPEGFQFAAKSAALK